MNAECVGRVIDKEVAINLFYYGTKRKKCHEKSQGSKKEHGRK